MRLRAAVPFLAALLLAAPAIAQTKFTFGTDWLAEAEHGGFYEAVALGLYKKHGLDVTIRMGGPQVNPDQSIASGIVDAQMSSGSFGALFMVQQSIPVQAVAAYFQKDPQVLISHPGVGEDTLTEMKGKPIMISSAARTGYWLFLKASPTRTPSSRASSPPNRTRSKSRATRNRWSTCWPITATPATQTSC
jgi:NitT/TauT family transport system substrate-binding protein